MRASLLLTAGLLTFAALNSQAGRCRKVYTHYHPPVVNTQAPRSSEASRDAEYANSPKSTALSSDSLNDSPFDRARLGRSASPERSNALLDQVTRRLESEKVAAVEFLGGGVNDSYKITFESGLQAVFKALNPERPNQVIREAVAYRFSRLLGLDIVPPTVVRTLSGPGVPVELQVEGSVQLFISSARPLERGANSAGEKILVRNGREYKVEKSLSGRRLRIFDWLINNHDRGSNAGNYLVSAVDGVLIGIDHSVSFVGHDKVAKPGKVPVYTQFFLDDREFYQKLRSASREEIRASLKGLSKTRITEFFERYDELMADFAKVLAARQAG